MTSCRPGRRRSSRSGRPGRGRCRALGYSARAESRLLYSSEYLRIELPSDRSTMLTMSLTRGSARSESDRFLSPRRYTASVTDFPSGSSTMTRTGTTYPIAPSDCSTLAPAPDSVCAGHQCRAGTPTRSPHAGRLRMAMQRVPSVSARQRVPVQCARPLLPELRASGTTRACGRASAAGRCCGRSRRGARAAASRRAAPPTPPR